MFDKIDGSTASIEPNNCECLKIVSKPDKLLSSYAMIAALTNVSKADFDLDVFVGSYLKLVVSNICNIS